MLANPAWGTNQKGAEGGLPKAQVMTFYPAEKTVCFQTEKLLVENFANIWALGETSVLSFAVGWDQFHT